MYFKFQQNRVGRTVQTVHTHIFANDRKLHKFATTNSNFEKNRLFQTCVLVHDMYIIQDIQADFKINRLIRYVSTAKRNYFHRRQTDGERDKRRARQQ